MQKGQTTIELLLVLSVSVVALAIIFAIYAEQVSATRETQDMVIARNTVQTIANAANTAYLSGIDSEIRIFIEVPESIDIANSGFESSTVSLRLANGTDVIAFTEIPMSGSFKTTPGRYYMYLDFNGDTVNIRYREFELNKQSIFVSILQGSSTQETFSVRNNYAEQITVSLTPTFSHTDATMSLSDSEVVLDPGATTIVTASFTTQPYANGNYAGRIVASSVISGETITKTISVSVEVASEFSNLVIYPRLTSISSLGDETYTKSYSICNKTVSLIENITWGKDGNVDANAASWFTLPLITDVNANSCSNFDMNIVIPTLSSAIYDANLTAISGDDNYTSFIRVTNSVESEPPAGGYTVPGSTYFSIDNSDLNHFFDYNGFVRQIFSSASITNANSWTPTGELDWNRNAVLDNNAWRDQNLVAYYKFNDTNSDGTGVYDSARGFDGALVNGADIDENNLKGMWDSNALILDGINDYVDLPNTTVFDVGTGDFTVSHWIKTSSATDQPTWSYIDASANGYYIRVRSTGEVALYVGDAGDADNERIDSGFIVNDGQWHHVVVSWDGSGDDATFTVDGFSKTFSSVATYGSITSTDNTRTYIGRQQYSGWYFKGEIDEVKFYNRILTTKEVIADYNSFLNAKFVSSPESIVDATATADWNQIKVNSDLNYNFNSEIGYGTGELTSAHYLFDENLIALWHLNMGENTAYEDASGNGLTLTPNGFDDDENVSCLWGTNCVDLATNDWLDTGATGQSALTGLAQMSVCTWVNSDSSVTSQGLFTSDDGTNRNFDLYLNRAVTPSAPAFLIFIGGSAKIAQSTESIDADGLWHHICGTYNGSAVELYVDAIKVAEQTGVSGSIDADTEYPAIGRTGNVTNYVTGKIDEVAVWDRGLTPQEITDLYRLGRDKFMDNNLVGLWHLNAGDADNAFKDYSGNDNGGSPQNFDNDENVSGLWGTNAFDFDGTNDYINFGDLSPIKKTGDYSVSAWFNVDFGSVQFIFDKSTNDGCGTGNDLANYVLLQADGDLQIYCGCQTEGWYNYTSTGVNYALSWNHIVITREASGSMKVYFNGLLLDSGTDNSTTSWDNATALTLHGYRGTSYSGGSGRIDEVAIWDRALSTEEILDLYRKGVSSLDLNVYSCGDASCVIKTSSQYISDTNNNSWMDLNSDLVNSRYLGYDFFFKQNSDFSDYNAGFFNVGSLLRDVNVVYYTE